MVISTDDFQENPALLFHIHHQTYQEDIHFWIELAARHGSPILELGCGTGRTLIPIAQKGYQVFGLDNDYSMLEVLIRDSFPNSKITKGVFQADAAAFHMAIPFALIIMPCNTFSTFCEKERRALLTQVSVHLAINGVFVACITNPELLEYLGSHGDTEIDDVISHPVTGNPVQVANSWKRYDNIFELNWHYDHLFPDGSVKRVIYQANHHIVDIDKYRAEFSDAGLSLSCIYGDYEFSDYQPDSENLILVGSKI
jgi:SAM-dependent methyltransferase